MGVGIWLCLEVDYVCVIVKAYLVHKELLNCGWFWREMSKENMVCLCGQVMFWGVVEDYRGIWVSGGQC